MMYLNYKEAGKIMEVLKNSKDVRKDNTRSGLSAFQIEGATLLLEL